MELLVPHRGPARLVERVLAWRVDGLECEGRIPLDSAFVSDGSAPAFVGIELGVQAAAAHETLLRRRAGGQGAVGTGYLVGIQEAHLMLARLPARTDLLAIVRRVGGAAPLSIYTVRVELGGVECLSATVSTYVVGRSPEEGGA